MKLDTQSGYTNQKTTEREIIEKKSLKNSKKSDKRSSCKNYLTNHLNYMILLLNIIGIILYRISLIGCYGGEENYCITHFVVQFKILGSLLIISSLIVSVTICLIIWKKIKIIHLIYIIPTYYIFFYFYDRGENLEKHGGINFKIFNIILILFIILINYLVILLKLFKKKYYLSFLSLISLILIFPLFNIYINLKGKCVDWEYGLNNEKLIYLSKEACSIYPPPKCELDYFFGKFNLSKIYTHNFNKKSVAVKYLSKNLKKSNHLGFPISNIYYWDNKFSNVEYYKYVSKHMIDMETFIPNQGIPTPEITVKFDKNEEGTLNINLIRNETLVKERKKLENKNSLFKNVLVIFIDTASRGMLKRGLKKLFKFLESFMGNNINSNKKYGVYQFFKYHSLGGYTHINIQPMFYGKSMKSKGGIEFIKYYKQNGYITGMSICLCNSENFFDKYGKFTQYTEKVFYDHENNAVFCDPNYYDYKNGPKGLKGQNSLTKRILYGKQANEIQIEYAKQFWEKYKDSRKLFKLVLLDGHEDTSETIKFLDEPLTNFLNGLYQQDLLKDSIFFIVSDHGLHMPKFHYFFSRQQFIHDRLIPLLVIFYDKNNNDINDGEIYQNQQKFVTAYDIYETFIHIPFGKENDKTIFGISLFSYIDESIRKCKNYLELTSKNCRCKIKK